jgi:hypothetical protein
MSFEFGVIINFVEIEVSFSTVRYYIIKNHYGYWLKRLFHWAADEAMPNAEYNSPKTISMISLLLGGGTQEV